MTNSFGEAVEKFLNTFLGAILGDPSDSFTVNLTRPPAGQPNFHDWFADGGSRWARQRRRRRLDPHVHDGEFSLVEYQLVRVKAKRFWPDQGRL
jgi:hypothetical protein